MYMDHGSPSNGTQDAIRRLHNMLGERLSTAPSVRAHHGKDLTWNAGAAPDAVAFVHSTSEVQAVVKLCAELRVPVIPFGTGTSLEGHFTAPFGGISIDLNGMNKILEVHSEDQDCRVEAGVTRKTLNAYVRDQGLFFPIDPGADASLGGMAATRASGTNAVRYGTMRENVMGLTVVMANGEIVRTGGRAKKSSAGYDLTRLMVGSEGTLGVITEVGLKLHGIPEGMAAGVCSFPSVEACCTTTIATIQSGIPVARIELVDAAHIKAINAYSKLTLVEAPTLFVEFHGTHAGVKEQHELFQAIAEDNGGGAFAWATREEDRVKLWQARHDAFWATQAIVPGQPDAFSTDVCVPISRLAECVEQTRLDLEAHNIFGPMIGHVGDGNFHVVMYCNQNDPAQVKAVKDAYDRLIDRALGMGGTCTGEHGIGRGKRHYLAKEHGNGLDVMRTIKNALDPQNIMNPGKNAGPDFA
jgi:D-lactate dehydrogenase (cytochrome)